MTAPPPPGWYPNQSGEPGQRYWDGKNWTEHRTVTPPPKSPAGWYPDPSGARGQRYFDGNDWTEHRAGPSATPQRSIPTWGYVAFAGVVAVVTIIALVSHKGSSTSRGSTSTSSAATSSAASTVRPVPRGFHSNIADIWLPQGATMDIYSSSKLEMWHANALIGSTTQAMNSLLPVNQPLDGLPWCGSTTGTGSNTTSTYWAWGTSTDKVSVSVADFPEEVMIIIGRDAPTGGVCRPGD